MYSILLHEFLEVLVSMHTQFSPPVLVSVLTFSCPTKIFFPRSYTNIDNPGQVAEELSETQAVAGRLSIPLQPPRKSTARWIPCQAAARSGGGPRGRGR